MMIQDGYTDIAAGKLAAIVTSLEMLSRPEARHAMDQADLQLERMETPQADWYLDLYRRIGEEWIWASCLEMPVSKLTTIIQHPQMEIWSVVLNRRSEGIVQLDFREENTCELLFFGVTRQIVGTGAGRWLMNRAIDLAWSKPISRFWLHTCTLDHPAALPFYIRSGFTPFRRQVEVFDDPRLTGILPESAAPNLPIIKAR